MGMQNNRVGWSLIAGLMMGPATAYALGMGDIDVQSGLNQSLDAKISIISDSASELERLKVNLAPREAFDRLGLERVPVLSNLQFEVVKSGPGAPYIKVSSSTPIREPFLDFVLSVSWANGQLFREFTVLLDPPVFDQSEAAPAIQAPVTDTSTVERTAADAFPATPPRVSAPIQQSPGSYGPTARADTLWEVALQMRPDGSVSVPQMMLALLQENPEAFYNNNINNLKAGYVLRAPDGDVISALSKQAAAAETNRQYQEWLQAKGRAGGGTTLAGSRRQVVEGGPATGEGATSAPGGSAGSSTSEGRLQLVSPEQALSPDGLGGASTDEAVQSLRQQLVMANEALETSSQENLQLRDRLAELETRLESTQRLVALRDESLAALQEGLAASEQAELLPLPAETAVEEPLPSEQAANVVEMQVDMEAVPGAGVDSLELIEEETLAAPADAAPAEQMAPDMAAAGSAQPEQPKKAATAPAGDGLLDRLMADPKLMAIAVAIPVLAVMLVVLIVRRRRQDVDDEDFFAGAPLTSENMGSAFSESPETMATGAPAAMDEVLPLDTGDNAMAAENADDLFRDNTAETENFSGFGSDAGAIHAEESDIDPIAEADVYLAYRRYEQAESLLKEAIGAEPDRHELKLKLLEIYFVTKDQEAFEAQAEAIYASSGSNDSDLWGQVVEMGRELCPDHPLFAEAGGLPMGDSVAEAPASEFDLDFGGDEVAPAADAGGLDLGLDLDDGMTTQSTAVDAEAPAAESMESLDFDLDLDFGEQQAEQGLGLDAETPLTEGLEDVSTDDGLSDMSFDELESGLDLPASPAETLPDGDISGSDFSDFDNVISLDKAAASGKDAALDDLELDLDQVALSPDVVGAGSDQGQGTVAQSPAAATDDGDWALQPALSEFVEGDRMEDEEYSLFENTDDVVGTKLDLAKAYIDMGDQDGALSILDEVVKEGSDTQRQEAEQLMRQIG